MIRRAGQSRNSGRMTPMAELAEVAAGWNWAEAGLEITWPVPAALPPSPFVLGHGLYHAAMRSKHERRRLAAAAAQRAREPA